MAIIAAVEAGGTKFICGLGTEDGKKIDRINIYNSITYFCMCRIF